MKSANPHQATKWGTKAYPSHSKKRLVPTTGTVCPGYETNISTLNSSRNILICKIDSQLLKIELVIKLTCVLECQRSTGPRLRHHRRRAAWRRCGSGHPERPAPLPPGWGPRAGTGSWRGTRASPPRSAARGNYPSCGRSGH